MVTKVVPVELGEVITAGNDYTFTITLTKDGATFGITGATVTASFREVGGAVDLIADHSVTITDAANGIIDIVLLDTETILFTVPRAASHLQTVDHIADVKVVEAGGGILHCGPFTFPVRRAIT